MAPSTFNSKFSLRTSDLVWREIEGDVVALNIRTSQYVTVNATGSALWDMLQTGTTREDLVQTLIDRFDVTLKVARRDVDDFVDALAAAAFLLEVDCSR